MVSIEAETSNTVIYIFILL